jgi:hypothetical protein
MTGIPTRVGPRPRTDQRAPHTQIAQLAPPRERGALSRRVIDLLADLEGVELGGSNRAPPGSVGLHLRGDCACVNGRAFLLGREFAHIHVEDDASLHAVLPEPLRTAAIEAGWAEPHPFAGQPTVSPDTVMIYAPRDDAECSVVADLVRASWRNAYIGPENRAA